MYFLFFVGVEVTEGVNISPITGRELLEIGLINCLSDTYILNILNIVWLHCLNTHMLRGTAAVNSFI